jgi:hypothetical protein
VDGEAAFTHRRRRRWSGRPLDSVEVALLPSFAWVWIPASRCGHINPPNEFGSLATDADIGRRLLD